MPGQTGICDNPIVAGKVIAAIAGGATDSDAANMIGCHRMTIYRFKNREEIKAEIEAQAQALMAIVPNAMEIKRKTIQAGDNALNREIGDKGIEAQEGDSPLTIRARIQERIEQRSNDIKIIAQSNDASNKVLQAVGILPTHTSSVVIGQLVLGDQTNVLAPNVQSLLDRQLGNILDVTPNPLAITNGDPDE